MHFPSLAINMRRGLDDSTARRWKNDDCGFALDGAAKYIQNELGVLKTRRSLSLVQYQREYDIPSNMIQPDEMEHFDADTGRKIYFETLDVMQMARRGFNSNSFPRIYHFFEEEGKIVFDPRPDTAAGTIPLDGAHNSTVTTFTVDSTTGFPTEGRFIVNNEVVSYTNKTSTTFTGCVRAEEGTVAASHNDNDTVTERDVLIHGARVYADREMWHYYTTGTATLSNASAAVTGGSTFWKDNVSVGDYIGVTTNVDRIDPTQWYRIVTVTDDTNLVLASNFLQDTQTNTKYIIGSPNPFPSYMDKALIAFGRSEMLKVTDLDLSAREFGIGIGILKNVKKGFKKSDRTLVRGSVNDRRWRGGRMRINVFGNTI